jgi:MoxR-like ATPase
MQSHPELTSDDMASLERTKQAAATIRAELGKVIVGQKDVIDQLLLAIFAQGHCLLEGVPGLAKTLMVSTLARSLHMSFSRIQFTPDLMPSDITGTEVIQEDKASGTRQFKFLAGPVFSNIILADEVNRTPPKTQAALLEAMQEKQVTIGLESLALPKPFFVLATQNPIEQEGTYRLPEAQLDRFLFKIDVEYPDADEEVLIAKQALRTETPPLERVLDAEQVQAFQRWITRVPIPEHVYEYAARLVRSTRPRTSLAAAGITDRWIEVGAGPRATIALVRAAQAHAVLSGEFHVSTAAIQAVARPVLRHRLLLNFDAQAEGVSPDGVLDELLTAIPAARAAS